MIKKYSNFHSHLIVKLVIFAAYIQNLRKTLIYCDHGEYFLMRFASYFIAKILNKENCYAPR
jgi:hypothetical protein